MQDPDFDPYFPPRAPVRVDDSRKSRTEAFYGNPWLTIWTRPRGTIRAIVDDDTSRSVILLSMLNGISWFLNQSFHKDAGDTRSLPVILGIALVGGTIGGVIWNYILAFLIRMTGGWLGGEATYDECRAATAWGGLPSAVTIALLLGLSGVFGGDLFRSDGLEGVGTQKALILIFVGLVQVVFGVWAMVLSVKCIAEVHRFSAWKSLGACLLVGLLILGFIILLALAFVALSAGRGK